MSSATLDLDGALKGFFQDKEWPLKIMLGGLINLSASTLPVINPAFVPISCALLGLSAGYLLRVMRLSIKGELEKLPDWNDILDLLISGLSWFSICMGFFFFILSVLAISLLAAGNTSILKISSPSYLYWAVLTFIAIYTMIISFKFFLATLMANFAEEERMLAGFAWRKVIKRIIAQPKPLMVAWLAGLTLTFVAVVLPTLTRVGTPLVPFLSFLAEVIAVRMIGQAWVLHRSNQT